MDSRPLVTALPKPPPVRRTVIRGLIQAAVTLVVSTLIAYLFLRYHEPMERLGPWNYLSAFLVEVATSATIIIPTPGQAYLFVLASKLNPLLLGLVGGIGAGVGEISGYLIGRGGHHAASGGRLYGWFRGLMDRWGGGILFAFAVLPVPFDLAGIWAGTVRYPLWRFLAFVTVGKIIKVTVIALAGYYSAPWLLRLIH